MSEPARDELSDTIPLPPPLAEVGGRLVSSAAEAAASAPSGSQQFVSRTIQYVCPYCGSITPDQPRCDHCHGLLDPLSRQATQNSMGPWFIHDPAQPFRPGCSFETLTALLRRGKIGPDTVLRGPTTRQFWTPARRTPGIANLLGFCHNCSTVVAPDDFFCDECGADFSVDPDRQFLGLGEVRLLPGQAPPQHVAASSAAAPSDRRTAISSARVPSTSPSPAVGLTGAVARPHSPGDTSGGEGPPPSLSTLQHRADVLQGAITALLIAFAALLFFCALVVFDARLDLDLGLSKLIFRPPAAAETVVLSADPAFRSGTGSPAARVVSPTEAAPAAAPDPAMPDTQSPAAEVPQNPDSPVTGQGAVQSPPPVIAEVPSSVRAALQTLTETDSASELESALTLIRASGWPQRDAAIQQAVDVATARLEQLWLRDRF